MRSFFDIFDSLDAEISELHTVSTAGGTAAKMVLRSSNSELGSGRPVYRDGRDKATDLSQGLGLSGLLSARGARRGVISHVSMQA